MAVSYLQEQPSPNIMRYREAQTAPCSGDLIDVFACSNQRVTIGIADVCGRDARAQVHARYLRNAIRVLADDYSPARLLQCMNAAFCRRVADYGDDRFASFFVATLHGRHLTYASAGHDFAILMNPNGMHRHLPVTGGILGVSEAQSYHEQTVAVANSDWLILVTDGVTDARNSKGVFFGTTGVVHHALAAIRARLDNPARRILDAAQTHGRTTFVDDASVLCVRFS